MSYQCPACRRRVRSAPYVSLQDKHTRKITRYHGDAAPCLEVGVLEVQRRGPDEVVLGFYHTLACFDAKGKLNCRGRCFTVGAAEPAV